MDTAKYVLKTVPLRFRGEDLRFELSHALFSSNDIDAGSRLLLKAVAQHADPLSVETILDIGSGVGVLGIACARGYHGSHASFRDRDALACAFTERNARLNKVKPEAVEHALFLEGLSGASFDLVLCNVPAKAGTPVLDRFLRGLPRIVSGRGLGAVVVVNTIAEATRASLQAALAPGGEAPTAAETGKGHTVFLFRRGNLPAWMEEGEGLEAYARTAPKAERPAGVAKRGEYRFGGYWGLPEFDTPSFATELAIELVEAGSSGILARRACVINPGSGRLAAFMAARTGASVDLCGRDALALRAGRANASLNAHRSAVQGSAGRGNSDQAGGAQDGEAMSQALCVAWADGLPASSYDLLAEFPDITPRVDTMEELWANARRVLKLGGSYVCSLSSSDYDRFERRKPKGFTKLREKKKKGWTAGLWRLDAL